MTDAELEEAIRAIRGRSQSGGRRLTAGEATALAALWAEQQRRAA